MLVRKSVKGFLRELSSKKPTPGGGSAAALVGAMAAGLTAMAAEISGNEKITQESLRFMKVLADLIDKDAESFKRVIKEKASEESLKEASEIPLQTARYAFEVLKLAETLSKDCKPKVITDVGVAAKLAEASVEGALLNVKINLISIKDQDFKEEIDKPIEEDLYMTSYRARVVLGRVCEIILNNKKAC